MRRTLVAAVAAAFLLTALPAVAATTPSFKGSVGPGFTISMAKKPTKAGKVKIVVSDKSDFHNFHLSGPGVNVKTSCPRDRFEDLHGHAEEGHLPVRVRPARGQHEGVVQGLVAPLWPGQRLW